MKRGRKSPAEMASNKVAYLEALYRTGGGVTQACEIMGMTKATYDRWRQQDPEFRSKADDVKRRARRKQRANTLDGNIFDPYRKFPPLPSIADFRWTYMGRPTPPHQQPICQAWEDETNLVVLVFGPPGSGKDTIAGDIVAREAADRATGRLKRIAWIMESEPFSVRRGRRLANYLTDPSAYTIAPAGPNTQVPTRNLIEDYGPFAWTKGLCFPDGTPVPRRSWSQHEMYFVGIGDQESDPDLWFTGMGGAVYGSRIDTLIISDPFTVENQRSPTERSKQMDFIEGTLLSRLDEAGRMLLINTRVGPHDNGGALMSKLIGEARPVHTDGIYTKYANGVATVIYPAVLYDSEGNEASYWPERFPLHDLYRMPDGTEHTVADLTDTQIGDLAGAGARYIRGLTGIRDRNPEMFRILYQQDPSDQVTGEFTDTLLDHCEDPTRSYGVRRTEEILILGIDPARRLGAAWVLWGWSPDAGTLTVVDYFFGTNLGVQGVRERLVVNPVTQWWPRYTAFEVNRDEAVLEHPDVLAAFEGTRTELVRHNTTGHTRNVGASRVAAMAFDMRDGIIRFPAATRADRERTELLKQHARNWDEKETLGTAKNRWTVGRSLADDIWMAAWVGWVTAKERLMRRGQGRRPDPRPVAASTARAIRGHGTEKPVRGHTATNLLDLWRGEQ